MTIPRHPARMTTWFLRLAMRCYPKRFRSAFGDSLLDDFTARYHAKSIESRSTAGWFAFRTVLNVARAGLAERYRSSFQRTPVSPRFENAPRVYQGDSVMRGILQDTRYALRAMRREPAFFGFAALIMGLGIGASTSVFSVISPLVLRPLPFDEPDRLVWVAKSAEGGMSAVTSRTSNLRDFRELNQSFEDLTGYFAFFDYLSYNLVGDGQPERLVGVGVAPDFLDVLGVRTLLGRNFVEEEGVWGGRSAVILSHGLWMRRFGGDQSVVGRSITLNDTPTEIVGVLPPSFDFASTFAPSSRADFLTTFPISDETDRRGNTLAIIGRLKPGATIESAQADLDVIIAGLQQADPDRWGLDAVVSGLQEHISQNYRGAMNLLAIASAVVLLIACANLSNLLLARGRKRSKEMDLRSVLGADRRRLVRQLTVESLLLGLVGGTVGVIVAFVATHVVSRSTAFSIPLLASVSVDGSVLLFTLVISLLAGLLVGVAPALQISQGGEAAVVNDANRGSTEGKRSAFVREGLVVAEVALACVLLVGGGLLMRSFIRVMDVDLGFQAHGAITWRVDASRDFEDLQEVVAFYDDLIATVARVPGVDEAGLVDTPPLGRNRSWTIRVQGAEDDGEPAGFYPRIVDWRYLSVMRVPLISGRFFTADDDFRSPNVIILNQTAAATLFPDENPINRNVTIGSGVWRVIGVVGDVRHRSLEQSSGLEAYMSIAQTTSFTTLTMMVRSSVPAASLVGPVRAALAQVDASMPTGDFETLDAVVDRAISPRRFILLLLGAFAGLALLLAALGIYAVLSYSVNQRVAEIGIRMALGESGTAVRRRVVQRTLTLAGTGIGIGAVASIIFSRFMRAFLFGVAPTDVVTFIGMAVLLLSVSAVAGYVPALRASRTDPMEALRSA